MTAGNRSKTPPGCLREPGMSTAAPSSADAPARRVTHPGQGTARGLAPGAPIGRVACGHCHRPHRPRRAARAWASSWRHSACREYGKVRIAVAYPSRMRVALTCSPDGSMTYRNSRPEASWWSPAGSATSRRSRRQGGRGCRRPLPGRGVRRPASGVPSRACPRRSAERCSEPHPRAER